MSVSYLWRSRYERRTRTATAIWKWKSAVDRRTRTSWPMWRWNSAADRRTKDVFDFQRESEEVVIEAEPVTFYMGSVETKQTIHNF